MRCSVSRSFASLPRRSASSAMVDRKRCWSSGSTSPSSSVSAAPRIAVSGVRSSWLTSLTNCVLRRSSRLSSCERVVDLASHLVEGLGDDAHLARALDVGARGVVARGERARRDAETLERCDDARARSRGRSASREAATTTMTIERRASRGMLLAMTATVARTAATTTHPDRDLRAQGGAHAWLLGGCLGGWGGPRRRGSGSRSRAPSRRAPGRSRRPRACRAAA